MHKLTKAESAHDSHEAGSHLPRNILSFRLQAVLFIASLVMLAVGFAPRAAAQNYAAVHGTITDSSGAVIPSATATILNTGTGIQTVVPGDNKGYYIFPQLQTGGPYTVTIAAKGFENFVSTGLTLEVNDNREVNAKLAVGSALQTIEVSATALQVETSNTQLQQIATADEIEQIPLEGRDASGLQKLMPGVVESSDRFGTFSSNGNETPQNNYLLNGVDNNDGALQNEGLVINPDALQEQNIVTSTINPEFARNSGAVINQVIKSGTNHIHGSGFEFYRDTFLNNGNYFSQTRPVFHQNIYGGTLGGPVLKDKLFLFLGYQGLRNRTGGTTSVDTLTSDQFAGNFTADTNYNLGGPNSATGLTSNPIPFAIPGTSCTKGEAWNACFPANAGATTVNIPTNLWNPVALALTQKYVLPGNSFVGGAPVYNYNSPNNAAADQGIIRLDYTPTKKDTIWSSGVFQSSPSFSGISFLGSNFPGFAASQAEHFKIFSASWTHTFSANKLNEVRGGYYRLIFATVSPDPEVQPSTLGFAITPQLAPAAPFIGIGNYFNLGFSPDGPQPRTDSNLTYADSFTWVLGNHTFKLGASYEQFRVHNPFGARNNGDYGFDGTGTYSSGDPLIDFALGIPDTFTQESGGLIDALAAESYAYAQDNWKMTPDLTLNFGLAYDIEAPNQNKQFGGIGITCWSISNATSNVFPGGPPGLLFPGDPGCSETGGPTTHYDHFAPRVGFAWSPSSGPEKLIGGSGSHNLSIRGGVGIYFNRDQEEQSLQNLGDPPSEFTSLGAADIGGSPSFANPFQDVTGNASASEANPFPYVRPSKGATLNWNQYAEADLSAFPPGYNVPYTYNYNLNIQRSIGGNYVAQIAYVGSVSHRLANLNEGDQITPAGHAACIAPGSGCNLADIHQLTPQYTAQPAIVPGSVSQSSPNGIPWYLSVAEQESEGSSNYNSFQASLQKAQSHGLQFTLAYTYSHALDDGSGYESNYGGQTGRVINWEPGFQNLNYGSSDFDARHRLTAGYVYIVPVAGFMRSNAILKETLSGWGLSGVTAFQTGFPIGINEGGAYNSGWCDEFEFFGCPDVPNINSFNIQKSNIRAAGHQYFATTPFSSQPNGTFGNTPRNFFSGPGYDYTNFELSKNIHFTPDSARYVQLRLEAFNAFNHANFAPPSSNFLSPTFGAVSSVQISADPNGDPSPGRSIQLAGKFYF
jgi:hypothetical protein